MGATDNRSEKPKANSDQLIKPDASNRGITGLALTLLLVVVIVTTAIVSVYRNELISTARKFSKAFISIQAEQKSTHESNSQQTISKQEPAASAVTPDTPLAQINPEKSDNIGASSDETGNPQQINPVAPVLAGQISPKPETANLPTNQQQSSTGSGLPGPTTGDTASSSPAVSPADRRSEQLSPKKSDPPNSKQDASQETSSKTDATESSSQSKGAKSKVSEEFQLPGSIRVKIHDYSGVHTKWALMVIVDNSQVMGKETKIWKPSRIKIASESVTSVMEFITPGSKIAVKDFLCKGDPAKQKGACPVHSLYDWSEFPFKGLKEKIGTLNSATVTNPCGTVLHSLKNDFVGVGNHVPRLLLITCGQAKCPAKETKIALNRQSPGSKVTIDVLAIGVPSKRHPTYSLMAKKTNGLFMPVETPAQLQNVLARYKKALRISTMEKIEIRNDNAIVSVTPDVEMALAPGSYTVVLPKIKGVADSHRSIPNVKIKSGHATVIEVNPKKGKATIRVSDKQRSAH